MTIGVIVTLCVGANSQASAPLAIIIEIGNPPQALDPATVGSTQDGGQIIDQMFTGLTRFDYRTGKLTLDLASGYTVSSDLKTWTFTMKSEKWSDGTPILASDVVYGIERAQDPSIQGGYPANVLSPIQSVTALDSTTVQFQLNQPIAYLPAILSQTFARPVPQHTVEEYGSSWTDPDHIVVSGAYTESASTTDQFGNPNSYTLVPNPEYYGTKPKITQVTYEGTTGDDTFARFKAGQSDYMQIGNVGQVASDPALAPHLVIGTGPGIQEMIFNTAYGPTTDVNVRRALSAATDRGQIATDAVGSSSLATRLIESPLFPGATPASSGLGQGYDLSAARAYAADAGSNWPNSITITYGQNNAAATVEAQDLKSEWEQAFGGLAGGFTVNLDPVQNPYSGVFDPDPTQQAPVTLGGWFNDYPDSANSFGAIGGRNDTTRWSDASRDEFDSLLRTAGSTTDQATRSADYGVAEYLATQDQDVFEPLYNVPNAYLHSARLTVVGSFVENWTVVGNRPINTVPPTITGTPTDGDRLVASHGTWTLTASFTYQWMRCGSDSCDAIGGPTTSATYTLTHADIGSTIYVTVTGSNGYGSSSVSTAPTATVAPAPPANDGDSVPEDAPSISGTAEDGQTLTALVGSWTGIRPITYTYSWERCDASGAGCNPIDVTTRAYKLTHADVDSTLRVIVSATNADVSGTAPTATSEHTGPVAAAPPVNVVAPSISGTAATGNTLTGSLGSWTGTPTLTITRQWERCDSTDTGCVDVGRTGSNTYVVQAADFGYAIEFKVTYTNTWGSATKAAELDWYGGRNFSGGSYGFNSPYGVAVGGGHIWVANDGANSVTELNASDGSWVQTLSGSPYGFNGPNGMVSDGSHIWVSNYSGNSVTELNASDGSWVRTVSVGGGPGGLAFDGSHIWVTDYGAASVTELNAADGSSVRTLSGGSYGFLHPIAAAFAGGHIWVTNVNPNSVTELNASDGTWVQTLSGGSYGFNGPYGIVFDGSNIWVANTDSLTELNPDDGSWVQTLSGGSYGFNASAWAVFDGSHIWVADQGGNSVTEVNAGDGSWVQTLSGGSYGFNGPHAVAFDGSHIWVTNINGNSVTELSTH